MTFKKLWLLTSLLAILGPLRPAMADPISTFQIPASATVNGPTAPATISGIASAPSTAQNTYLNDQIAAEIMNHGTAAFELRAGQKQTIVSDNVIEIGHLKSQYILAFDGSVYQNPSNSAPDFEAGLRLNLHSIVNNYVTFTPQWQPILGNLEYYPRIVWDFGLDRAHAWVVTFNLGLGFGQGAGFPAQ